MAGPKTANGSDERKTRVTMGPLCLLGTSSPRMMLNESWPAAAMPLHTLAPIRASTLLAVAPMMHPIRDRAFVPMVSHFRPKMSLRRPKRRNPTPDPSVQAVATQLMLGEGPIASLMSRLDCHQPSTLFVGLSFSVFGDSIRTECWREEPNPGMHRCYRDNMPVGGNVSKRSVHY